MAIQQVFKRYEKKYILTQSQEKAFLDAVADRMHMDKYGEHTICNIYFDTDDYDLIRASIEKPVYKEKLRLRSYGTADTPESEVFVELKKKYKGIVYKRRTRLALAEAEDYLYRGIHPKKDTQIIREIDWFLKMNRVSPKVYLAYDRRAYVGNENKDFRLTLDKNIRCRTDRLKLSEGSEGEKILDDEYTLMEIKIPGAMPVWMSAILSELNIYSNSFSKYGKYYMMRPELYMTVFSNHNL